MWRIVYLAALVAALLVAGFLNYYAYTWLGSIGAPADAFAGYSYFGSMGWAFLWVSAVALLAIGIAVYWTQDRIWALWTTVVYFLVFVFFRAAVLEPVARNFVDSNGLHVSSVELGAFFTFLILIVSVAGVYFVQFIVTRAAEKLRSSRSADAIPENSPTAEK